MSPCKISAPSGVYQKFRSSVYKMQLAVIFVCEFESLREDSGIAILRAIIFDMDNLEAQDKGHIKLRNAKN